MRGQKHSRVSFFSDFNVERDQELLVILMSGVVGLTFIPASAYAPA